MSMRERVEEYLAMRRSLGFKLAGEGEIYAAGGVESSSPVLR